MLKKWRVLLKLCHVPVFCCCFFLSQLSYVQVFSMNFLHHVFVTGWNDQNKVENVTEKQPEKAEKKEKKTRKEQASGTRKRLSTALRTEGEKLCIQSFSIYLEREVADGKCFRRRQTFLVELIQTVISTVETRHRLLSTPSVQSRTFSYLHFFSSVLLHYSTHDPRLLMYTKGSSCRVCPRPSRLFLCGYGEEEGSDQ